MMFSIGRRSIRARTLVRPPTPESKTISRAAYILATEKVGASIPGMGGMVMGNIVSTLLVLPFPFFITGNHLEKAITDPALLGLGFVMGLLASALPALGEVSALRMLPSNVYSVVLSLEPAFAAIVGIFMLAENTGQRLLGISGVMGFIVVYVWAFSTQDTRALRAGAPLPEQIGRAHV